MHDHWYTQLSAPLMVYKSRCLCSLIGAEAGLEKGNTFPFVRVPVQLGLRRVSALCLYLLIQMTWLIVHWVKLSMERARVIIVGPLVSTSRRVGSRMSTSHARLWQFEYKGTPTKSSEWRLTPAVMFGPFTCWDPRLLPNFWANSAEEPRPQQWAFEQCSQSKWNICVHIRTHVCTRRGLHRINPL